MIAIPRSDANGLLHSASRLAVSHPLILLLAGLAVVLLFTRLTSGNNGGPRSSVKTVRLLPYWIPWVGHAISFGAAMNDFVAEIRDNTKESITAIYMGGQQHNLVTMPSVGRSLMALRPSILSVESLNFYILNKFFGDRGTTPTVDRAAWSHEVHRTLNLLLKEPFLSEAVTKTASLIEEKGPNLVSFNASIVDQSTWEKAAGIEVIEADRPTVVTELASLVRNFVGDIACEVLMGSAFMANNPNVLQDLMTMDSKFALFMLGIPRWAAPGMWQAVSARKRLLTAIEDFSEALNTVDDGLDPGHAWNDMSDVSSFIRERRRAFRKCAAPIEAYSAGDLSILWAMNINANQLVFWLLYHILSQPLLKEDILREIAPYARLSQEKSGLHIDPPPKVSLDVGGIVNKCPLLKATMYETMRIDTSSVSYKEVISDFRVTEKLHDANVNGKAQPDTYELKQGQWLATCHGTYHTDPRLFPDPTKFDPKRFLKPDVHDPSKLVADMHTIAPFGGGHAMCKGRLFAEREILLFASSILTGWDIVPSDPNMGWKHPGRVPGSSTFISKSGIEVRVSRRQI